MKRQKYLRLLRILGQKYGFENAVYIDESGFKRYSYRPHGWAPRGQKVYGNVSGSNRKASNLIMAQRDGRWLAPEIFTENCTAQVFNTWLENRLLPLLKQASILILDNARFHKKDEIRALARKKGHVVLFLPPYSPDLNKIEPSFGVIKNIRQYKPPETQIIDIIKTHRSYLE